jgi:hypothetical protein
MDGPARTDEETVRGLAVAYCEGIHFARRAVFEDMCHERFAMTAVLGSGGVQHWDKPAYLDRVSGRDPFPGQPSYEILDIDVAGGEIARVHLWVDVPPRRFEDHLGFVRTDGAWKLMTKVFRTLDGPAMER